MVVQVVERRRRAMAMERSPSGKAAVPSAERRRELEQAILSRQKILSTELARQTYDERLPTHLSCLAEETGALLVAVRESLAELGKEDLGAVVAMLGLVGDGWQTINTLVDSAVALAIGGQLNRRFMQLSPLANGARVGPLRRLERLREEIAARLIDVPAETEAGPAPLVDPDLPMFAPEPGTKPAAGRP
jgi:hypothetical protein